MKKLLVLALAMVFLLGAGGLLLAQPEATGYTLSDIYYYLSEGREATWGNHSLEPQSGVLGQDVAGFSQSLEDIVYYWNVNFSNCNVNNNKTKTNYVRAVRGGNSRLIGRKSAGWWIIRGIC